jgi:hypothetical protein
VPQAAFLSLAALSGGSLLWLHLTVLRLRAAGKAAVVVPDAVPAEAAPAVGYASAS